MTDEQIIELLRKYKTGKLNPDEKIILESWYIKQADKEQENVAVDFKKNLEIISSQLPIKYHLTSNRNTYRIAFAASILIFISFGAYLLLRQKQPVYTANIAKKDVEPGRNKATLTLGNGKKLILDDVSDGQLANEAGVTVHKNKSGQIIYTANTKAGSEQNNTQFNTLSTANGEQYQVILPDGTHVWLNAASSIKYPVAFAKGERLVELTGEAYFEVVHDQAEPFKVKTQQQIVEDVGTHFNINAYDDEQVTKTTLVEGAVKVSTAISHKAAVIKPGQQSRVNEQGLNVQSVDIDEVLAWKDGNFDFNEESLESTMKKIARWYDVEVVYEQKPINVSFYGEVSRSKNLSAVLSALSKTGKVHFRLEAKKLIVW